MSEFDLAELSLLQHQLMGLLVEYGTRLLSGLGTLVIGFWLAGRLGATTRKMIGKIQGISSTLVPVAGSVVRYAIAVLTIIITLGQFGIQTTSIIAILGAAGLAIGLALQGTLANVAAGVMLIILRPFNVGDWVEVNQVSGSVREIGLFTTQIDTFDNVFISVPNSTIWSSTIINHAKHRQRRLDVDIGVDYASDIDLVEKAMLSLANDERVHAKPAPVFLVTSYGDSAINVRLRLYTDYNDLFALNWDLLRRLKPALDSHNISIPFPHRVIQHMNKADDNSASD
ncbi:MAG: mechanosensitive ion channel family protein [Candidatus Puniceispirillaceae bacterium]